MSKKNMPTLFDVNIEDPEEIKASKFIFNLTSNGFIENNKVFLENYINADMAIAFSHIKKNYKTYVCKGKWTEKKFQDIIYVIAKDRQMLIPNVFLRYGAKYDDGKLSREVNLERKKYEKHSTEKSVSAEEQELLDYIAKHGGR